MNDIEEYKQSTLYSLIYECTPSEVKGLIEPSGLGGDQFTTGYHAYNKLLVHYLGNVDLYKQTLKNEFHNIRLEPNESFDKLLFGFEKLLRQMELLNIVEDDSGKKLALMNALLGKNDGCGRDIYSRLKDDK